MDKKSLKLSAGASINAGQHWVGDFAFCDGLNGCCVVHVLLVVDWRL
ncbi:MAG: hypothetical protein JRC77_05395 [Deltaproteobacteria bacterium]|nr:hypothetical protein [Deltaproteobacteria bacterium]